MDDCKNEIPSAMKCDLCDVLACDKRKDVTLMYEHVNDFCKYLGKDDLPKLKEALECFRGYIDLQLIKCEMKAKKLNEDKPSS